MNPRQADKTPRGLLFAAVAMVWIAGAEGLSGQTSAERLKVVFLEVSIPDSMQAESRHTARVTLKNAGTVTWTPDVFRLSYHWGDSAGQWVVRDGERTFLPRAVSAGGVVELCATVQAPRQPGTYELQWDLVQEGVTWFSAVERANLHVQRVTVSALPAGAHNPNPRGLARTATFLLVTVGHFALIGVWLRILGRRFLASLDEYLFLWVVFGFGTHRRAEEAIRSNGGPAAGSCDESGAG